MTEGNTSTARVEFTTGVSMGFSDRKITTQTCKKFGVTAVGTSTDVKKHIYPYTNKNGAHVANKIRLLPKTFAAEGTMNNQVALFGQDKFPKGGKAITIYEGELDAMAGYQITGSLFPCVSLPNGSSSAVSAVKHNLEYLESFEKVVLCFDNDEAGKKAVEKVVPLFAVGKCRIMKLQFKDACDYLQENKTQEFTRSWHQAETWTPKGVLSSLDVLDMILNSKPVESLDYPWDGLTDKTDGLRLEELVTVTADTGIGKTQVIREIMRSITKQDNTAKVGTILLEESPLVSGLGQMSMEANVPTSKLIKNRDCLSPLELKEAQKILELNQMIFYGGQNDIDEVIGRIRYYAKGLDCKYIILDHLSMLVSGVGTGDERKLLDEITTKIKALTMELNVCIIMIVHTNRQGEIRGTAGVEQLSNMVIHLERDLRNNNELIRNTMTVTVRKNRFSGSTGVACYLKYDEVTGRMTETVAPVDEFDT